MLQTGFYLTQDVDNYPLTEIEIGRMITTLVNCYEGFNNEVIDLIEVSGKSEDWCDRIVRKRYRDFIIN